MKFLRYLNRRLALYCQNGNTLLVQVSLSSSYVHIRVSLVFKKNIKFCSDMFTPGGMDSQPHFLGIWIGYIQYIVYSIWVLHTYTVLKNTAALLTIPNSSVGCLIQEVSLQMLESTLTAHLAASCKNLPPEFF